MELNPVAAGICDDPLAWKWSSARANVAGVDDQLCCVAPMLARVTNWNQCLNVGVSADERE